MRYAQQNREHTAQRGVGQLAYALPVTNSTDSKPPAPIVVRRRRNMERLIEEAGGLGAFASQARIIKSHVSAMRKTRGIGAELAARMERAFKRPPGWLDQDHADPTSPVVAQESSPRYMTIEPTLTWEEFGAMVDALPDQFALVLRDQALAPRMPRGTKVEFRSASTAEPGQVVLVEADGAHYVRHLRLQGDGTLLACALSPAWPSFREPRIVAVAEFVSMPADIVMLGAV